MVDAKVAEFAFGGVGGFSPICHMAGCVAILCVICCCFGGGFAAGAWW